MKIRLTVTIDLIDGAEMDFANIHSSEVRMEPTGNQVSREKVANYVADAVSSWGGQFHPDDELFPTNIRAVTVTGGRGEDKFCIESRRKS